MSSAAIKLSEIAYDCHIDSPGFICSSRERLGAVLEVLWTRAE
jgi:hypothetical protein